MAPTLGFTALLLLISLSFFLPIFNFFAWKKIFKQENSNLEKASETLSDKVRTNLGKKELSEISLALTALIFLLAIFAQGCLIYSYAVSDYSVANVYQNSHHLKPLLYKITGSWGNHEGSMLLLLSVLCGYSLAFALLDKSENKSTALSVQSLIVLGFASFTAFASNPFTRLFPTPTDGLSLNPLLQDIGLALHPPMLYTGYIGFSLVFSLAIAALLHQRIADNFAKSLQFWLTLSWGFLTLGIGLGSWWAYRELGWGGYWFWDPVENVSLMPWLAGTALIHSAMLLRQKNIFQIWTILLAIINFILCLIGIFLTRSGLLTSVHSFAIDAKRGFFIILLISIIGGIGLLIFALKAHKLINKTNNDKDKIPLFSKVGAILLNNYLLTIALFTTLLGTLYPIFAQNFFDQSIAIGANYYNQIFAILLAPFLLFLIASYFLHFSQKTKITKIITLRNSLILVASSSLTILATLQNQGLNFLEIALFFFTLIAAFLALLSKKTASNIAHLGFTLLIAGIILSSCLGTTKEMNIKQSEIVQISQRLNYQARFENVSYKAGENFLAREANFTILENGEELYQLKPQLRYYPISDQTTNEASIHHGIFGDIYLAIGNKDENGFYALRIYFKPFIYLIWLGCVLMFAAAMLKVFQQLFSRQSNGAKAL